MTDHKNNICSGSGSYMTIGTSLGLCIGTAIGVAMDDLAVGMGLGISMGAAIGAFFNMTNKCKCGGTGNEADTADG